MRLRRRPPEERNDQFEHESREAEHYEFDDARHFAGRPREAEGQSEFARRGQSHEERMRDDDSRERFAGGYRPEPNRQHERAPGTDRDGYGQPNARGYGQGRGYEGASRSFDDSERYRDSGRGRSERNEPPREGYYGSGGSYGYGGGFEHDRSEPRPERDPRSSRRGLQHEDAYRSGGDPGPGNEEFYEATGGFGYDVSGYGRHGFGYPGRGENRGGVPGGGVHHQDARGYFNEQANRPMPGRGYFNEDVRQGFTQNSGYSQSGGERTEPGQRGSGYGQSSQHSDARGHEGGGRGAQQGPRLGQQAHGRPMGRGPKGYTRSDERVREDLCDQLGDGHVDASDISVNVVEGVVTLEGFVGSRSDKFDVEELAASVSGVKDVENRLRVRRPGQERGEERAQASSSQPNQTANESSSGKPSPGTNGLRG